MKRNNSKSSVMKIRIITFIKSNIINYSAFTKRGNSLLTLSNIYGVSRCRFSFTMFLIDEVYKR